MFLVIVPCLEPLLLSNCTPVSFSFLLSCNVPTSTAPNLAFHIALTSDRLMIWWTCCQCCPKESITALLSLLEMSCVRREKL